MLGLKKGADFDLAIQHNPSFADLSYQLTTDLGNEHIKSNPPECFDHEK